MSIPSLQVRFERAAATRPEAVAVVEPGRGEIAYRALDGLTARVRDRLRALGAGPGQRVGMYLHKSIDSAAAMYGILKTGAAYVPVDPDAPPERNAYIMADCSVLAVFIERARLEAFRSELEKLGAHPVLIPVDPQPGGRGLAEALERLSADGAGAPSVATVESAATDLAYILYTSGSTGRPKGVMLSHENAATLVDWCS